MPNLTDAERKAKKKAYDAIYRKEHRQQRADYNHKWYEKNKEEALKKNKEYRMKNKHKWLEYQNTKRKKDPNKISARQKVYYAIKTGKLIKKPCEICGDKNVEAHHEDYGKPLEVRWLCKRCHKEYHNNKKGGHFA